MRKKLLSVVLVAAFATTTLVPITAKAINFDQSLKSELVKSEKNGKMQMVDKITKMLSTEGITERNSQQNVELLLISDGSDVTKELEQLNAKVYKVSTSVYLVNITAENAYRLAEISSVTAVGKNKKISLDKPTNNKSVGDTSKITSGKPNKMEYCHEITGIKELWKKGYDGKGMKIAIVDSGIEAANEMFTCTPEGKLKIVDYKCFNAIHPTQSEEISSGLQKAEGDAILKEVEVKPEGTKRYVEFDNKKVYVPQDVDDKVLIGYYEENDYLHDGYEPIKADINNNGKLGDKFLIVIDKYKDNIYGDKHNYVNTNNDRIYIDVNSNDEILDDVEMQIYREGAKNLKDKVIFEMKNENLVLGDNKKPVVLKAYEEQYKKLYNSFENNKKGKNAEGTSYDFVISDVFKKSYAGGEENWYVTLGFDANSHGTHVSGESAGNGYEKLEFINPQLQSDKTIKGTAPGAELMALKVLSYTGSGDSVHILAAMEYAAEQGADVINVSIGSQTEINDGINDYQAVLIEQLAKKYGVIVSKSAGNAGPRINSTGGGAANVWSFSTGAYNSAWLNYGYPGVEDCLWYFSSNGPTEDGRFKPDFVAPGSQISSYPNWYHEEVRGSYDGKEGTYTVGHGLMEGTSMSSPYAGGVVAVLRQAINDLKIPYHPLVLQEAMINSADETINNKIYRQAEIGGGLIQPVHALAYLQNLKANGLDGLNLKNTDGSYSDRNKLFVLSKVNYTENLNYKPEGLLIRDGNIPNSVKVTLTNDKDVDVSLNLQKDSYNYSNAWLTLSDENITIPRGTSKVITLFIDKSKLNKNLNCVNIVMDDKTTPLKDGVIPVTVTNYIDLTAENPEQSELIERDLPLEQAEKHFVRVPAGTNDLKFTVEKLDPSEHTALDVSITSPTGIKEKTGNKFKVDYSYASQSYNVPKDKIVPGTWEVDVRPMMESYSNLGEAASKAKNRYKFTARVNGFIINPKQINFEGTVGQEMTQRFTASNTADLTMKGLSLLDPDPSKYQPKIYNREVKHEGNDVVPFVIEKTNPNYFTNIEITNSQYANDDLDMEVYRLGATKNDKPVKIGSSGNPGSKEKVSFKSLPAGKYAVLVVGFAVQGGGTTKYALEIQTVNASDGTQIPIAVSKSAEKPVNEVQAFDVKITHPTQLGNLLGYIIAEDANGNEVSRIPVNVNTTAKVITKKLEIHKNNMPKQFAAGNKATVKIEVENLQKDVNQDITLIVGLYDKNNKLIQMDKEYVNLTPNQIKEITAGNKIIIPNGEGYVVRCFVWDSIDKMNPLHELIEIPVK